MEFGSLDFWEEKYTNQPELYEWVQTWQTVKQYIGQYIKESDLILNLGCGNSGKTKINYFPSL